MRRAWLLAASIAIATPSRSADWVEGVPNFALQPGPWIEGYIPTPPPSAAYRENADSIETIAVKSSAAAFLVWVWKVRTGGEWDYKKDLPSRTEFTRLEAAGNFNFGVTAAALGLPYEITQMGAGVVQLYTIEKNNYRAAKLRLEDWGMGPAGLRINIVWDRVSPFYYGSTAFFDDPNDAVSIKAGYDWYLRTQRSSSVITDNISGGGDTSENRKSPFDYLNDLNTPFWEMLLDRGLPDRTEQLQNHGEADPFDWQLPSSFPVENSKDKPELEPEPKPDDKSKEGPEMSPLR